MAKKLTKSKAREILHDKEVHGHPLTEQQRKFFGAIAGGAPMKLVDGGKVTCTCGHSWNKSDSSKKDAYVCHICGKTNNMKDGGWLDKYDAPQAQNGIEGTMGGLTDIGFKHNGAWGGAWRDGGTLQPPMAGADQTVPMYQMGGNLPGAVGFMYARTQSPAPSNGPYAKKTKASAQNGQEMKFYQEGLDFKPKTISQDGSRTPIYISDPNDPRLKTYQDSLYNYNVGRRLAGILDADKNLMKVKPGSPYDKAVQTGLKTSGYNLKDNTKKDTGGYKNYERVASIMKEYQTKGNKGILPIRIQSYFPNPDNTVIDIITGRAALNLLGITSSRPPGASHLPQWKKPEQQVILDPSKAPKKQTSKTIGPFPIIETPRRGKYVPIEKEEIDLGYELPTPKSFVAPKAPEQTPTKYTFTYPTGKYNEQKTMYFPSKSALKSFTEGVRGATYQEGADYASATGTLQDGGDIPVDPMGYWNPDNVGNPVIIPSTDITMEGVDQPLIGISDTGDVQYMEPGEDYEFDGEYVTEYPVAKGGISVNEADAQPLKKLDQLLNFTNYNKPTKGGWLDKYQ